MAERTATELLAAAESGDAEACFIVGYGFTHGEQGFAKDAAAGRLWLMKSAERSPEYAAEVAMWILDGAEPFEKNEAFGLALLRTAAAQGDSFAQLEYAMRCDDPAWARETLLNLASAPTFTSGRRAAHVLLGPEEAERYVQWTIHECKDVQKRRATLERRTDPNAKRGILPWRAPWL